MNNAGIELDSLVQNTNKINVHRALVAKRNEMKFVGGFELIENMLDIIKKDTVVPLTPMVEMLMYNRTSMTKPIKLTGVQYAPNSYVIPRLVEKYGVKNIINIMSRFDLVD